MELFLRTRLLISVIHIIFVIIILGELKKLKPLGLQNIAMTTNGVTLKHKVERLKEAGLDQINFSFDTLIPAKFEFITRRKGLNKVMEGLDMALDHGFDPVKVKATNIFL